MVRVSFDGRNPRAMRGETRRRKRLARALATAGALVLGFTAVTSAEELFGAMEKERARAVVRADEPPRPRRTGDHAVLDGPLDLRRARLVGDRYEVPLSGGRRAVLTLRPAIQRRAEQVLAQADAPYGAIVVMAPDGRVLAATARSTAEPRLDPAALIARPWAPSASIFKIVTAAALLDAGVEPDAGICYHGGLRGVAAEQLRDDPRRDKTCNSLTYGLARSQNVIMAKLAARKLDVPALRRYAAAFGYDAEVPFALAFAPSTTQIPSDPLEFARTAAGFWHTTLSPLGGAIVANTVATGGLSVTPRLVEAVEGKGGVRAVKQPAPHRVLSSTTARKLARMLVATVESGTARTGFRDPRTGRPFLGPRWAGRIAGKTGSLMRKGPDPLDYSWFVGFAPADPTPPASARPRKTEAGAARASADAEPRVVVSVLLGNSLRWRLKAHTAARLVLEAALPR